ncbi:hypothetical protein [Streptomyces sp. NBC_00659]|uniref:hypothetical protein n=1 Tax=Streptomyces sp. NBC_00659 TaxID=2903669 RepID=UPI003FCD088B
MAGAFPGEVLERRVGEAFDLVQAEFLALVDVRASRQGEHQQGRRPCSAGAQGEVGGVVTPVWARP